MTCFRGTEDYLHAGATMQERPLHSWHSAHTPDVFHLVIIVAGFDPESFGRVGFRLAKASSQVIRVIRDNDDLTIGDADELVGVRGLRILERLFIDLAGKLAIEFLGVANGRHLHPFAKT